MEQCAHKPFELANGDRIWFLPADLGPDDVEGEPESSDLLRDRLHPRAVHSQSAQPWDLDTLRDSFSKVLTLKLHLDMLLISWVSKQDGLWVLRWRIWSRPVGPGETRSKAPFSLGAVSEGLRVPEALVGQSLKPLGEFFVADTRSWESLINFTAEGCPTNLGQTLSPEAKALLEFSTSPAGRRELVHIPSKISPVLAFIASRAK